MISWTNDDSFTISGVEYACRPLTGRFPSTSAYFCLRKARWQVDWYAQLLSDLAPKMMVQVGISDGASMALTEDLAHPRKLVGVESRASRSVALSEFTSARGLHTRLRSFYGVDQMDTGRIDEILSAEFNNEDLDLVVDDASHLLDATRVTFNCVFPRLRPGGFYVIEHWPMHRVPQTDRPLTLLLFELILACSDAPGVIENVSVNRNYALVTRGHADLDRPTFDLSLRYGPNARSVAARFL